MVAGSRGAADNYHEDHIAARHAACYSQGSVTPTPHMLSLTALAREVPGSTELGSGSCRSLLSRMMSPGLYFSTSFSRRFVIVTIQSTYLIIIINYIYNIYSISTISTVYLQSPCTQHTVNCTVTWPRPCRGLGSSHTCTYHSVIPSHYHYRHFIAIIDVRYIYL